MTDGNKISVKDITQAWQTMQMRWGKFRADALRNYRYAVGDQIDGDVLKQLEEDKRPAQIYNLLHPIIMFMSGMVEQNRVSMKATPMRQGDEQLAELHTVMVSDWAMRGCDAYEEIGKAAMDAVIAKIGWTNNRWDTKRDADGSWITEAFDPMLIMFDPDARKLDQSDWRYYTVSGMYSSREILAMFGRHLTAEIKEKIEERVRLYETEYEKKSGSWLNKVAQLATEMIGGNWYQNRVQSLINDYVDSRSGLYRVIEFHERRNVVVRHWYDPLSSAQLAISEEQMADEEYKKQLAMQYPMGYIVEAQRDELWVSGCVPALLPDDVIFEVPYEVQGKGFQHKPIFCFDWHPDLTQVQSVLDSLISPQDSFNQRRMSMLEMLLQLLHPDYKVPKNSILAEDYTVWKGKQRGKLKEYSGPQAPEKDEPNAKAAELIKLLSEEDKETINRLALITPNMMGLSEHANEPASLYAQRVEQGMVGMKYLLKQVRRSMRHIFNYCDANLQKYLTEERMLRLVSPQGDVNWITVNEQTVYGVLRDVTQGDYDFVADYTKLGETARRMNFYTLLEMAKSLPPDLFWWPGLFDAWDSPDAGKFKQYAESKMQMANAMAVGGGEVPLADDRAVGGKVMRLPIRGRVG